MFLDRSPSVNEDINLKFYSRSPVAPAKSFTLRCLNGLEGKEKKNEKNVRAKKERRAEKVVKNIITSYREKQFPEKYPIRRKKNVYIGIL